MGGRQQQHSKPRVPGSTGQSEDCRGLNEMLWQNSKRFISYVNKKVIQKKVRLLHSMDE